MSEPVNHKQLLKHVDVRHKRAARALAYVLGTGETDAWYDYAVILNARLKPEEIAGLAFAALLNLETEHRLSLLEIVGDLETPSGPPMAPFAEDIAFDATWWANIASKDELRAYLVAIIDKLDDEDRTIVARNLAKGRT